MSEIFDSGVWIVFLGLLAMLVWLIKTIIDSHKYNKKLMKELEEPIEEAPAVGIGARVMSKRTDILRGGSYRMPSHRVGFYITFLTDDGKTVEHEVGQDVYGRCDLYQTGTLVTINGEFFDFGKGEDI